MIARIILLASLSATWSLLQAQTILRVMDYNLLNFPEPNPAGKEDTLAKILAHHPVDLLICQEVRTEAGAQLVLDQSLNVNGETRFSMAAWEPMHSDPGADYFLQQIIYYDHDRFTLKEQGYLTTYVRDLNWYTLYVNDDVLPTTHDTTFLTVFAVHLKAGNSTWNANERDAMAQVLVDHLSTLPPDRHLIVAGDMNLYTGYEDAFQTLTDPGNAIVLEDPINTIGDWSANSMYAGVHTQSTREWSIYGDGAGGGMDDRFDIALCSSGLLDDGERLHVVDGSYRALGNSGDCFNQSITDCSTLLTPFSVLRSLYFMSDHLPVVFDLAFDGSVGIASPAASTHATLELLGSGDGCEAVIHTPTGGAGRLRMIDARGRCWSDQDIHLQPGTTRIAIASARAGLHVADLLLDGRRTCTRAMIAGR